MKPLRVLLSAYQCAPGMGSVSQIGWEWYSRLSARTPVTLLTHVRNREALTAAGAPLSGSEVIYIDTEWFAGPLYRCAKRLFPNSEHAVFLLSSADFYVYDGAALRECRRRGKAWDVVHAVTPVSPLAATRLHRLGAPLVVGPWNGNVPATPNFPDLLKADSGWVYRIRGAGKVLDSWYGCTRRAAVVLSASRATDDGIPPGARRMRMIENGVDPSRFLPRSEAALPKESDELRALFVGRLLPTKGVAMLLEAVARVRESARVVLTIVGDGPMRGDLEREAARLGLQGVVTFTGAAPQSEVARLLRESHVFCFPSIRESGGAVLIEAAACGVPSITVNLGGPGELVDDEVGLALPADGPEQLTRDLAAALLDVVRRPEEWRRRGRNARRRVEEQYTWDAKMNRAQELYRAVVNGESVHV
jgi:glycosyltransferase involved in cell wall biosynthesis